MAADTRCGLGHVPSGVCAVGRMDACRGTFCGAACTAGQGSPDGAAADGRTRAVGTGRTDGFRGDADCARRACVRLRVPVFGKREGRALYAASDRTARRGTVSSAAAEDLQFPHGRIWIVSDPDRAVRLPLSAGHDRKRRRVRMVSRGGRTCAKVAGTL